MNKDGGAAFTDNPSPNTALTGRDRLYYDMGFRNGLIEGSRAGIRIANDMYMLLAKPQPIIMLAEDAAHEKEGGR
jgi:hypothetical protein